MSVMAHMNERERRKVKDIDYNILDAGEYLFTSTGVQIKQIFRNI
jgi:hypothetical protein